MPIRPFAAALLGSIAGASLALAAPQERTKGRPPRAGAGATAPNQAKVVPTPPEGAPSFLLVTMDTTRADHLGCYGYSRPTTPNLDRLATESVLFENCQSTVTITTPSHTSILTGTYPFEHGVTDFSFNGKQARTGEQGFRPTDSLRTIAQHLADHGWHTGGFVTAATTKRVTGLAAGFSEWSEPTEEVRLGEEATRDALAWLEEVPEPFFLWVHYFDAHKPPRDRHTLHIDTFAPDAAMRQHMAAVGIDPGRLPAAKKSPAKAVKQVEEQIAQYDVGLRRIDDLFGDLRAKLEARGVWPRTTVLVVGDHGEGLGQHAFLSHGPIWREGTHVPFLLRAPGLAPARVPSLVSTIDAVPTALAHTPGLPGAEFMAQASGKDVLAADFEPRPVFAMAATRRGELSIHTGRWHFIRRDDGTRSLFDLEHDLHELTDLVEKHPNIAGALELQLLQMVKEQRARHVELVGAGGLAMGGPDDEDLQQQIAELAKLGYTEEGGDDALPGDDAPPADGKGHDSEEHDGDE